MSLDNEIAALRPKIMQTARKLTKNFYDAEDLTQNALVKAIEKQANYQDGNLCGWVRVIAYRQFYNDVRGVHPILMEPAVLNALAGSSEPNQEHWVHLVEVVREQEAQRIQAVEAKKLAEDPAVRKQKSRERSARYYQAHKAEIAVKMKTRYSNRWKNGVSGV